jgi:hypothetical protein
MEVSQISHNVHDFHHLLLIEVLMLYLVDHIYLTA